MKLFVRSLIGIIVISLLAIVAFYTKISLANEDSEENNFNFKEEIDEKEVISLFKQTINGNHIVNFNKDEDAIIEPEIYQQLEEKDKVTVVIKLKDNFNSYDLEEIKSKSNENIDNLLAILEMPLKELETDGEEAQNNFEIIYRYESLNALAGKINSDGLEILKNSGIVEAVYAERILQTNLQQSLPLINATQVWSTVTSSGNLTGAGQTVCVVDSGIDYNHQSLGGCLGTNCKVKGGIDFVNMDFDPDDDSGHGTHVAGIVAANGNIRGVAPNADLIAAKVCNATGSCPSTAMIAGVDYCISNMNSLGTDIITMSMGDSGSYTNTNCPNWMNFAINFANSMNIPMTVSSGNNAHKNGISYPACAPNVISVGATYDANVGSRTYTGLCSDSTTSADKVICFTNSGNNLDVMAPGSMITSTSSGTGGRCGAPNSQGSGDCFGTSMAAPHVAGTIALMKQLNPTMSPAEIEIKLKQNGKSVTDLGNNLTFTRIDSFKSINNMMQTPWSPDYNLATGVGNSFESTIDANENLHIVKRNGLNLYYTKTDNNGNRLITDLPITVNANVSGSPSIAIDIADNINIAWEDNRNGNPEIYYKKINANGNTVVNDTRITTDNAESRNPKIAMDNLQKAHIVFQDKRGTEQRWRIYYEKLNADGTSLINEFVVDNPDLSCNPVNCWSFKYARNPSISLDNQGNIYLTYEFMYSRYSEVSNGDDILNIYKLYYKKLNNNGNVLINDVILQSQTFRASQSVEGFVNVYSVKLKPDSQGNVYLLRKDGLNITVYYVGNYVQYTYNYGHITNFWKLLGNSTFLWAIPISSSAQYGYSFTIDSENNSQVIWSDPRNGQNEIYYKKIGSNGNTIVNDQRLTFASSPSVTSTYPTINIDSNKELNIFFAKSGLINYKRTMNNLDLEIPQSAVIGNTIPLHIKDIQHPGSYYVLALSYGYSPGILLPDGRLAPLNPDYLLYASISNYPLFTNFQGYLDLNGRATAYLTIPNNVQFVGTTIYAAFITGNATAIQSVSPYFPIQITA